MEKRLLKNVTTHARIIPWTVLSFHCRKRLRFRRNEKNISFLSIQRKRFVLRC